MPTVKLPFWNRWTRRPKTARKATRLDRYIRPGLSIAERREMRRQRRALRLAMGRYERMAAPLKPKSKLAKNKGFGYWRRIVFGS